MNIVYTSDRKAAKPKEIIKENKNVLLLKFGVFFDGTSNSIANIDERKDFKFFKDGLRAEKLRIKKSTPSEGVNYEELQFLHLYERAHSKNESYKSEYTNVARFYKCFKTPQDSSIIPIYIEGIGTKPRKIGKKVDFTQKPPQEEGKYKNYDSLEDFVERNDGFVASSDDEVGGALGIGLFGVKKKVESACEKIKAKITQVIKDRKVKEDTEIKMELYVFGFSRGAAAARCFSACLHQRMGETKEGVTFATCFLSVRNLARISNMLKKENEYRISLKKDWLYDYFCNSNRRGSNKIWISGIKVKFLGLYDTVSSYGLRFDDDVDELSLKIGGHVEKTFQICAGDEYRKNFALTDITSAGTNGKFLLMPGPTAILAVDTKVFKPSIWSNLFLLVGARAFVFVMIAEGTCGRRAGLGR